MMKKTSTLLPILCLLTLSSCGGSGGGSSSSSNGTSRQEMQTSEGHFKAILRPYNFSVSGWIPNGVADLKVEGDEFEVKAWLDDSAAVTHRQSIHFGSRCPDLTSDANKDGYVDYNETLKVVGDVLIPLDADLNSVSAGAEMFPKGDFTYFQKASVSKVITDLNQTGLDVEGKVIIVMGSLNKTLPDSVSTVNGQSREFSIPIACGVVAKHTPVANN